MLEIRLQADSAREQWFGGKFSVQNVRIADSGDWLISHREEEAHYTPREYFIVSLKPLMEQRDTNNAMYKRKWAEAHIWLSCDEIHQFIEALTTKLNESLRQAEENKNFLEQKIDDQ